MQMQSVPCACGVAVPEQAEVRVLHLLGLGIEGRERWALGRRNNLVVGQTQLVLAGFEQFRRHCFSGQHSATQNDLLKVDLSIPPHDRGNLPDDRGDPAAHHGQLLVFLAPALDAPDRFHEIFNNQGLAHREPRLQILQQGICQALVIHAAQLFLEVVEDDRVREGAEQNGADARLALVLQERHPILAELLEVGQAISDLRWVVAQKLCRPARKSLVHRHEVQAPPADQAPHELEGPRQPFGFVPKRELDVGGADLGRAQLGAVQHKSQVGQDAAVEQLFQQRLAGAEPLAARQTDVVGQRVFRVLVEFGLAPLLVAHRGGQHEEQLRLDTPPTPPQACRK